MWSHSDILFSRDPSIHVVFTRIAPYHTFIECEYAIREKSSIEGAEIKCFYRQFAQKWWKKFSKRNYESQTISSFSFQLVGLKANQDYEFYLQIKYEDGTITKSPTRLARTGKIIGTVVNYIHPKDEIYGFSGLYPASPSILKLPNGRILVSHDVYKGGGGQNLTRIYYSQDEGKTFHHLSDLFPCFWGKLFLHKNEVYMIATSTEYGDLIISKSTDDGKTFLNYTILIPGGNKLRGGPHKAPMPVIEAKNRIWTAIDYGSWTIGHHDSCMISAPIDADLLDAKSWIISKPLRYDPTWKGTVQGGTHISLLEGNAVLSKENEILNIPRYHTLSAIPDYGKVVVLKVNEKDLTAPLEFKEVTDFIGNMSKFSIIFDEKSGYYYSLVNRVTNPNRRQRNIVSLVDSSDLHQWELIKDVIQIEGDTKKVAAQYIDFLIDNDNILFVSRTAMNHAHNFHDANYITFHVINNFQNLNTQKNLNTEKNHTKIF
jgi:hypothetical protein